MSAPVAVRRKGRYPRLYCPKCMWRLSSGPCPKHSTNTSAEATEAQLARVLHISITPGAFTTEHVRQAMLWLLDERCDQQDRIDQLLRAEREAADYAEKQAERILELELELSVAAGRSI